MSSPTPPPWSPDPAGGSDQYMRTSQIVIGLDGSGRPSVALDGVPLPVEGGWQAAVDSGFAQVADSAERVGEPIAVTVIDTASDWTGRFVVQADRSIAEDIAPPPPARRRRGPFLALLGAATVLVVGSAVVVATQLSAADQPLASAPPATERPSATPNPLPLPTRTATQPTLPPPGPTSTAGPTVSPSPVAALPPLSAPPATSRPAPRGPEAAAPAPRVPAPRPAPKPSPGPAAPRPAPAAPKPQPAPRAVPQPAPAPAPPAPVAQGVKGRVIDGVGTCLGASSTTLGSGSCLRTRTDQIWTQTATGQLATSSGCLTAVAPQALAVQPCRAGDTTQNWHVADRRIVNQGTGDCALVRPSDRGPVAATVRCGTGKEPTAQFVQTS